MGGKNRTKKRFQPEKSKEGALERFCHNPSSQLSSIKGKPLEFESDGTTYKVMRVGLVPNDIEYTNNTLNAQNEHGRKAISFHLASTKKALKALKDGNAIRVDSGHGAFAIVHGDVKPIDPNLNVATNFGKATLGQVNNSAAKLHAKLEAFCSSPANILSEYEATQQPYTFKHRGKEYKVTPTNTLPENIKPTSNEFDVNTDTILEAQQIAPLIEDLAKNSSITITSEQGSFAIVHESVELITPETPAIEELDAGTVAGNDNADTADLEDFGVRITGVKSVNGVDIPPVEADDSADTDTDIDAPDTATDVEAAAIEIADTVFKKFETYKLSEFSNNYVPQEKEHTAYDFVTQQKGISVISYNRRKEPIGFMLPHGSLHVDGIETKGRWKISQFMASVKAKWAAEPLNADIITISNQNKAPMTFITMGTALELRKKGLFSNAPKWVHDHLNQAQADVTKAAKKRAGLEGVDTNTKPVAPKADTPAAPVAEPKAAAPVQEEPAAAAPIAKPAEQQPTAPATAEQAKNALAAVSAAITKARETQQLIKVEIANQNAEDAVHIGADETSIEAMEQVIQFANEIGANAAKIETIEYNPSTMVGMMTAIKGAWTAANDSDSLIILQPEGGQRLAMTRNADLLQAYKMDF